MKVTSTGDMTILSNFDQPIDIDALTSDKTLADFNISGSPIRLEGKVHLYGADRVSWVRLTIEYEKDRIVIIGELYARQRFVDNLRKFLTKGSLDSTGVAGE